MIHYRSTAFYSRLGGFILRGDMADADGRVLMSRAIQICGTWRTHFAWHFARALGWEAA